jgi:hypothetical protein
VIPPLMGLLRNSPIYDSIIAPVNNQFMASNPFLVLTPIIAAASGSAQSGAVATDMLIAFVRNHLILSFVLGCAATLAVRRAHLKSRSKTTQRRRWRLLNYFRPSVGNHPMLWKELFAEPAASRLGWLGRIALTLIVLGIIVPTFYFFFTTITSGGPRPHFGREYIGYSLFMGTLLGCGGLLLVAARAAGSITSEKERDCWTSLLSTPLNPSEIVWAKIVGSAWSVRGLVLLLALIWGLGVVLDPKFLVVTPFLLGTFVVLAVYAASLGVRYSLWCRNSLRAMAATLATGLFVGGLYFLTCCVPVMIASTRHGGDEGFILTLAPCVPFLLALPGIVYTEGESSFRRNEGGFMLVAYVLGTVGYLVAAILLAANSTARFDVLCGRTGPKHRLPQSPFLEPATDAVLVPPSGSQATAADASERKLPD